MANLKTTQAMPPSLDMSAPLPGQLPVAGAPHGWDAVGIAPAQGGYSGSSPIVTLIQTPVHFRFCVCLSLLDVTLLMYLLPVYCLFSLP